MKKFMEEEDFYNQCVQNSKDRFNSIYSLMQETIYNLFDEAIEFKDYSKYELFFIYSEYKKYYIFILQIFLTDSRDCKNNSFISINPNLCFRIYKNEPYP